MKACFSSVASLFLLVQITLPVAINAQVPCHQVVGSMEMPVRFLDGGMWYTGAITIQFPQHGSGTYHHLNAGMPPAPCNTGQVNCTNDSYEWLELDIDGDFEVDYFNSDTGNTVTIDKSHVEAHYDNIYIPNGFTQVGAMDFSRNCHGYTFGKDHHDQPTADSVKILLGSGQNDCYFKDASADEAVYAVRNVLDHSAKVDGVLCMFQIALTW